MAHDAPTIETCGTSLPPVPPGRGPRLGIRVSRGMFRVPCLAALLLLVAGCASTQIGAQWVDTQYAKQSLQGTTVLVACEAQDTTVRLLCESKFAARLAALGAKPLSDPRLAAAAPAGATPAGATLPGATPGAQANAAAVRAAAKEVGARSVLQVSLRPDYSAPSATPSFSFGIGGFGGSGGGARGGVGGGVGVAVPVGASGGAGMAGSSTLVDVASGRVIWSARATAPASSDLSAQVDELAAVSINALQQAGLF
jgi:hypothetical protein